MKKSENIHKKPRFFTRLSLLLLLFSFLLTSCTHSKPFYKSERNSGFSMPGPCVAVKSTTNIFSLNDVTLSWHYGQSYELGETLTNINYREPMSIYFSTNTKSIFIKQTGELLSSEKYMCDDRNDSNHHGMGFWEELTVPKEIFDEERGSFTFSVRCVATEEKTRTHYCSLQLYYEKIGNDKVRLRVSE